MNQKQRITLGILSLRLEAVIGVRPAERLAKQPIEVSLSVDFVAEKECVELQDTVDYSGFAQIVEEAAKDEPGLLEQLASAILKKVFALDARIDAADIEIKKRNAVKGASCSFVRIRKERH